MKNQFLILIIGLMIIVGSTAAIASTPKDIDVRSSVRIVDSLPRHIYLPHSRIHELVDKGSKFYRIINGDLKGYPSSGFKPLVQKIQYYFIENAKPNPSSSILNQIVISLCEIEYQQCWDKNGNLRHCPKYLSITPIYLNYRGEPINTIVHTITYTHTHEGYKKEVVNEGPLKNYYSQLDSWRKTLLHQCSGYLSTIPDDPLVEYKIEGLKRIGTLLSMIPLVSTFFSSTVEMEAAILEYLAKEEIGQVTLNALKASNPDLWHGGAWWIEEKAMHTPLSSKGLGVWSLRLYGTLPAGTPQNLRVVSDLMVSNPKQRSEVSLHHRPLL